MCSTILIIPSPSISVCHSLIFCRSKSQIEPFEPGWSFWESFWYFNHMTDREQGKEWSTDFEASMQGKNLDDFTRDEWEDFIGIQLLH